MSRGKESSNRIELSRLVQDLLNFGVSGSLQLWLWGGGECMGVWGSWECALHMCTWTCTHACTHAHIHVKHDNFNCKWPPPLGESLGIPYDVTRTRTCMRVHACACMCMCVGGNPQPPPTPMQYWGGGGTPGISQNSIALELIKIFQFRLKI